MNKVIAGIGMVARLAMGLAILAVVVVWNALTRAGDASAESRPRKPHDDD
ncbi:hypothetical protein KZJ38_31090 [Paraburkholderia edwinii]|uniref:Uncharacterized protein n=1 Tax=Paraburkholderia edwinii TaxID=2861782 RepID=A0ABX8UR16_9BURK|nr:hypothetical protein [Paraburkholderia edwinii]QYD71463.1 hypothetical protein KZJ38_31090 [Paraburkholderia edwinii]